MYLAKIEAHFFRKTHHLNLRFLLKPDIFAFAENSYDKKAPFDKAALLILKLQYSLYFCEYKWKSKETTGTVSWNV